MRQWLPAGRGAVFSAAGRSAYYRGGERSDRERTTGRVGAGTMRQFPYLVPFYGLASALLFALSNHFTNMGLERSDARSGTFASVATSALAYWLFAPFFLESWYWLTTAALMFGIVGIIRPALSTTLAISSIKLMGPTLTSSLTAVTPIFGAMFAIILLGERLSLPIAMGTAAVVAGAVVAAWNPKGLKRTWPLWAIALPLGASLIRAIGHIVTKYGLLEVDSPSFAVLVGNTVSLATAAYMFRRERRPVAGTPGSLVWFIAAGIANALSLQFLNNALALGDVVAVVPIVSATPVFTLLLGFFYFGRETITWRTVATIGLIVPGVILVALSGRH
jgi:DME family drug/metabolite transporter